MWTFERRVAAYGQHRRRRSRRAQGRSSYACLAAPPAGCDTPKKTSPVRWQQQRQLQPAAGQLLQFRPPNAQALTALLSGEMRDTAELGAVTKHAAENYLPQVPLKP